MADRGGMQGVNLDHQGMEVLDTDKCWTLAASVPVGRIAFIEAGEPMVFPVNHAVVGHRIAFRTLRGTLLHEALMDRPVAFEADDWEANTRNGWSVVIRGLARIPEDTEPYDALGLDAWADATAREDWVVIEPEEISGRRIVH